jgi:hypothetical protein
MLWTILRPSPNMRLDDMATVQERHLSVGFNPYFISSVFGENGEGGDVKPKFARIRELACEELVVVIHGKQKMPT